MSHIPSKAIPHAKAAEPTPAEPSFGSRIVAAVGTGGLIAGGVIAAGLAAAAVPLLRSKPAQPKKKTKKRGEKSAA